MCRQESNLYESLISLDSDSEEEEEQLVSPVTANPDHHALLPKLASENSMEKHVGPSVSANKATTLMIEGANRVEPDSAQPELSAVPGNMNNTTTSSNERVSGQSSGSNSNSDLNSPFHEVLESPNNAHRVSIGGTSMTSASASMSRDESRSMPVSAIEPLSVSGQLMTIDTSSSPIHSPGYRAALANSATARSLTTTEGGEDDDTEFAGSPVESRWPFLSSIEQPVAHILETNQYIATTSTETDSAGAEDVWEINGREARRIRKKPDVFPPHYEEPPLSNEESLIDMYDDVPEPSSSMSAQQTGT